MRRFLKVFTVCTVLAASPRALAATCPLEGEWDTGYVSEFGHGFTRLALKFDCAGKSTLTAYNTRGKLIHSTSCIIERQGTYTVVGPTAGLPGAVEVDVTIDSLTMRYLDPISVEMEQRGNLTCRGAEAKLMETFSVAGKSCNGAVFPALGFIERAVAKVDGDLLYWSTLYGPQALVVQPPTAPVKRNRSVDAKFVFKKR